MQIELTHRVNLACVEAVFRHEHGSDQIVLTDDLEADPILKDDDPREPTFLSNDGERTSTWYPTGTVPKEALGNYSLEHIALRTALGNRIEVRASSAFASYDPYELTFKVIREPKTEPRFGIVRLERQTIEGEAGLQTP